MQMPASPYSSLIDLTTSATLMVSRDHEDPEGGPIMMALWVWGFGWEPSDFRNYVCSTVESDIPAKSLVRSTAGRRSSWRLCSTEDAAPHPHPVQDISRFCVGHLSPLFSVYLSHFGHSSLIYWWLLMHDPSHFIFKHYPFLFSPVV